MSDLASVLSTVVGTLADLVPIVAILLFFQRAVLRRPLPAPRRLAIGLIYAFLGLGLFVIGLETALFPLGTTMAQQLASPEVLGRAGEDGPPSWSAYVRVYAFAAAIGFATTVAEPALIAVSLKAEAISGGVIRAFPLRLAVGAGVAAGVALGTLRIVTGLPLPLFIITGYAIVLLQTFTAPRLIVPLAFDTGGVTTSTVTVPIVTALGLGLAGSIAGRDPLIDGFGLIAFASLCPIMSVLAYAWAADRLQRRRRAGTRSAEKSSGE